VQIRKVGTTTWKDISPINKNSSGAVWTYPLVDLTEYAADTVQIAFYFVSDGFNSFGNGWYIDDIVIITGSIFFNNPESWESGIGEWYVDYGTWEVGTPKGSPDSAYNGNNCAATVLNGNYSEFANTSLISPAFVVPASKFYPRLRFWHYYAFAPGDSGRVQIRKVGTTNWKDISPIYNNSSGDVWTYPLIDLSDYATDTVQIAFYFFSDGFNSFGNGWYIDDVALIQSAPPVVNFSGTPISGGPPLLVQFSDQSTNNPTSWNWVFGDGKTSTTQNPSHTYNLPGIYTVSLTAKNTYGSDTLIKDSFITVNPFLHASISPNPASVYLNTNLQLNGNPTGGSEIYTFHQWSGDIQYLNLTSIEDPVFNCPNEGNYNLKYTVTDNQGHSYSDSIIVNVFSFNFKPEICIVTVDTSSFKNMIIWNSTQNSDISYYIISRETSTGIYDSIGYLPATEDCIFIDYMSTPRSHAYQYRIIAVKNNGDNSAHSPFHKTIHLGVSLGMPQTNIELNWSDYKDESSSFIVSNYYIYRGSTPNNLQLYQTLPGSITSFTDINVFSVYYYAIGVMRSGGCSPLREQDYSSSFSNIENNSTSNLSDIATLQELIFNGKSIPGFDPLITDYNITLSNTIVPTVIGIKTHPNAMVYVADAKGIPGTTSIVVTAENGINTKIYNIHWTYSNSLTKLNSSNQDFIIFPNPFTESTTIRVEEDFAKSGFSYTIYDYAGKQVMHKSNQTQPVFTIEKGELTSSIYFIEIEGLYTLRGKLMIID